jgi:glycosyltransferase involved in cell wall biosynthesis
VELRLRPFARPGFSPAWLLDALRLDGQVRGARPDLFHALFQWNLPLRRLPVPVAGHVYDLMPLAVEDIYLRRYGLPVGRKIRLYRAYLRHALRRVDRVIAISEHTKRDLVRLMGFPPERVRAVLPAPAPGMRPPDDPRRLGALRARLGLPEGYLLYTGGYDYRKNVEVIVRAHTAARKKGLELPLVLAGGMESPYGRRIQELASGAPGVVRPGFVPDEDLPALYAGAGLVLYPSLYEGFGLPVVDAMACGAPVACSDHPSLDEAAGGAALRLPAGDESAWAEAMLRAGEGEGHAGLRPGGLRHAGRFSWERTARETFEVYRELMGQI